MNILLACEQSCWTTLPSLMWTIAIAAIVVLSLYIVRPLIKTYIENTHEKEIRQEAFEREMQWFILKNDVSLKEYQKKKDELQKELNDYKNKEEEINEGTASLKKDKEKFEKKILETKIKVYEEILKTINK